MIKNPEAFEENLPAGYDGFFDWDFLKEAFSRPKITPMDFDCVIERNGHFLVFETKKPGMVISEGQKITLATAVATGFWTCIFLETKQGHEIRRWQVWRFAERGRIPGDGLVERRWFVGSAQDLVKFTMDWFRWASNKRRPKIEIKDR